MAWQPGWQTATEMEDEWYEDHGYEAMPSAAVQARWADVREAEREYAARATSAVVPAAAPAAAKAGEAVTIVGAALPELVVIPAHPVPGGVCAPWKE